MKYISTRDKQNSASASRAIIQGISKDGGLFVPHKIPKIALNEIKDLDYNQLAYEIMKRFLEDFDERALKRCIDLAYDKKFENGIVAPLVEVGDTFFLELYHGPTLAFKDMALSILPHLLKEAIRINKIQEEVVILTATSGDTGKAALEGFADVDGIKIIVFYPENGVSEVQKLQMKTQEGSNVLVVGINGNFDDAQSGVKEMFNDSEFVELLSDNNFILSSANSINIGRLIPQVVYYFHSYISLLREGKIEQGEKINISVPTGNFGNILAAYYAKQMGLPVNKLICASNDNHVLTDFIKSGVYDKRRELKLTSSPSMDILISSNLERLLYHLSKEDDKYISGIMKQLSQEGIYEIEDLDFETFYAGYSNEEDVEKAINKVFKEYNYLVDTHTAVALDVYEKYREKSKDDLKTIVVSTASPFKFASKVASAIGVDINDKDEFHIIDDLAKKSNQEIPSRIANLKDKEVVQNHNCNKEDMKRSTKEFLKVGGLDD